MIRLKRKATGPDLALLVRKVTVMSMFASEVVERRQPGTGGDREILACQLDGMEVGLDIHAVREIVRMPRMTALPHAPRYVEGVANLRGSVLPIINTRQRFSLRPRKPTDEDRVVVVDLDGRPTGLIVDSVREVLRVSARCIRPTPLRSDSDHAWCQGIVQLDSGNRMIVLLDHNTLIDETDFPASEPMDVGHEGSSTCSEGRASQESSARDSVQIVLFRLGDELYGLSIHDVREIIRVPEITRLPEAPTEVLGIASLRNEVVLVVDLRARLIETETQNQPQSSAGDVDAEDKRLEVARWDNDDTRCLVVQIGKTVLALLVDAVEQVLGISTEALQPPPASLKTNAGGFPVSHIVRLTDRDALVSMLDLETLIPREELEALDQVLMENGKGETVTHTQRQLTSAERKLATFRVGEEEFAVDIMNVQEIVRLQRVTAIPQAPPYVTGVVNLRGNVLPVIDLRARLGLELRSYDDATRVVVVKLNESLTGLIVDSVCEVLTVTEEDITPTPPEIANRYSENGFLQGICMLEDGNRLVLILSPDKLLPEASSSSATSRPVAES